MSTSGVEIRPVAGRAGAEIVGLRLSPDLRAETVQLVRQAILDHKVVFVRDQGHLDERAQDAVAALFGEPVGHPTLSRVTDRSALSEVTKKMGPRTNNWHTDITFVADYPAFTFLRAVAIPPAGGETLWANTAAAYADLPPVLMHIADELRVVHTNVYDWETRSVNQESEAAWYRFRTEFFASTVFETEHPLVRVHPESGERSLLLGAFANHGGFVGLDGADSRHFFDLFQHRITTIENTVRWRWTPGDLAIWDNRATQHYASHDYGNFPRMMYRTTTAGEWPVGVDGQRSVVVTGGEHPWYEQSKELVTA
jgi:alpha-ketoglutarate-dependent taurine dioxygenase